MAERKPEYRVGREDLILATRDVAELLGFKVFADLVGRPRAVVSQALHTNPEQRNNQHLHYECIVDVIRHDRTGRVSDVIVAAAEPEFTEREQILAFLEALVETCGPDINRLIHTKATEIMLRNRRAPMRTRAVKRIEKAKKAGGIL